MIRLSLGVVALVLGGLAFNASGNPAPAPEAPAPVVADGAKSHTLTIDYQRRRGALRPATLTLAPVEPGARPLWRGRLAAISVLTTDGQWIHIDRFREREGHLDARATMPAPSRLAAVLFHPRDGRDFGYIVGEVPGYTKVEWTYHNQEGEEEDPPKDPPEDPEDPDDPGDDDDEGCSVVGCDMVDPWTCECYTDTRDPWENSATDTQVVLGL
jgi:hypothetical protein